MDRSTGNVVAVAGGAVVLYALSPPFVAWVCLRLGFNGPSSYLQVIYAPMIYLYEHFPPYKALMDAAAQMLGVS